MRNLRLLAIVIVGACLLACGSGGDAANRPAVVVETVAPRTPVPAVGGKPQFAPPPASGDPLPTAVTGPEAVLDAPTDGHWIDVDVSRFTVRLMGGTQVLQTIGPVAVGAQVDTGVYESTQTGLFHVYSKIAGLQYDAPYDAYISDWVGFDLDKANGFHSFLQDADGNVTDARTGRISNGCIRTPDSTAVFAFAEIGMPVYVHQ